MTAKDKAKNIVNNYYLDTERMLSITESKHYGLKCVDEIIDVLTECETYKDVNPNLPIGYWKEVKKEIEKI